jgi:hypothetical protein
VLKKSENNRCAAFAKSVHYKEPRDDHGPTFDFSTCFGQLAALPLSRSFFISLRTGALRSTAAAAAPLTTIAAAKQSEEFHETHYTLQPAPGDGAFE